MGNLDSIIITPLKNIQTIGGNVLHCLNYLEDSYINFGEAYFSLINYQSIKGWKMHKKMTLNLVVPIGNVKFIFVQSDFSKTKEIIIGDTNYCRITVPPGIWFGFKGLDNPRNLILNIADIKHDTNEVSRIEIDKFKIKFT